MNKRVLLEVFISLLIAAIAITIICIIYGQGILTLNPKGMIAFKERELIFISTLLMLLVVIPVFIMTVYFSWKYRSDNVKATYDPNWDYSFLAEAVWWGVPFLIVVFLSVLAWNSSHELDPHKPIESDKHPVRIQVVALQWRWLFIYPEYEIATINYIQFPEQTPINFEITADAPMNSFWIPQLGGQIYAMPGMKTLLHLVAEEPGDYRGSSANLSGRGFAAMAFTAKASTEEEFQRWVESVQQSPNTLDLNSYKEIMKPNEDSTQRFFSLKEKDLFEDILMKYMMPTASK